MIRFVPFVFFVFVAGCGGGGGGALAPDPKINQTAQLLRQGAQRVELEANVLQPLAANPLIPHQGLQVLVDGEVIGRTDVNGQLTFDYGDGQVVSFFAQDWRQEVWAIAVQGQLDPSWSRKYTLAGSRDVLRVYLVDRNHVPPAPPLEGEQTTTIELGLRS